MSAASEARKVLDRAATKFGAGALTTEGDAVAYVNARDALIAAVRAEERARCVAVVSRIADDVREELRIDSGIVGHTVGQKSHRLDGVDALEDALTAALTGADK